MTTMDNQTNLTTKGRGLLRKRWPHKAACCFFAVLLFYNFIVILRCNFPSIGVNYTHYAIDYTVGFCTRLLPGAVYNLFVPSPSAVTANIYVYLLTLLLFAAVSLLLERVLLSLPADRQPLMLLLFLFYLTGPATFSLYAHAFGLLDLHWLILMVPFFLLLRSKWGLFLLPAFPLLLLLTSFGAIVSWIPFTVLLILYELTLQTDQKDRRRLTAVFLAALLTAGGSFLYFAANEKKNLVYTVDEFNQYMHERGCDIVAYYDDSFYDAFETAVDFYVSLHGTSGSPYASHLNGYIDQKEFFPEMPDGPLKRMINEFGNRFARHWELYKMYDYGQLKKSLALFGGLFLVMLPPFVLLYSVLVKKYRAAKGKKPDRFLYFCCLAFFPLLLFAVPVVSTDTTRWIMHAFMILFTFVIYMVYREKEAVTEVLRERLAKIPRFAILFYYAIYAFTFVTPYTYY